MPEIQNVVNSRLATELRQLVGLGGPRSSGVMQMRQASPSDVVAVLYLAGGKHAVIGWCGEQVIRELHASGDDGYLNALDSFCAWAGIGPLDIRQARRQAKMKAAAERAAKAAELRPGGSS